MKFKTGALKLFALVGFVVVVANVTGGTTSASEYATTQDAVEVFERICLSSLPNFATFSASAEGMGLRAVESPDPFENVHVLPDTLLAVGLFSAQDAKICNITLHTDESLETIGTAVLSSARSIVGNGEERAFRSSSQENAIQLSNGSLIIQVTRVSGDKNSATFFLTSPISEEQIRALLQIK